MPPVCSRESMQTANPAKATHRGAAHLICRVSAEGIFMPFRDMVEVFVANYPTLKAESFFRMSRSSGRLQRGKKSSTVFDPFRFNLYSSFCGEAHTIAGPL